MATKWGIAGSGNVCHDFALTITSTLKAEEHQIVAVAARDLERAKAFAEHFKIAVSYGSYEHLAKDPHVEVVYVGIVNPVHFTVAVTFLENGKHVLCEKPMTMSKEDTAKLIKLAKSKKLFLMEGMSSRFYPIYQSLHEELALNTIGEIQRVEANVGIAISHIPRVAQKELGGSAALDIGVYCVQFIIMLLGKPTGIRATGTLNRYGVDEAVSVIFKFPGGKLATMSVDTRLQMANEAYVWGNRGMITVCAPFWSPTKIISPKGAIEHNLPTVEEPFNFHNNAGLRFEAMEVRKCLLVGETECDRMTHQESLDIAEIIDWIRDQIYKNPD